MTTREVEIQTTETREVTVCDYCGLDEDEGDGEMRTFQEVGMGDAELHLHSECVEAGVGDLGPMPTLEDNELFTPLFALDEFTIGFAVLGGIFAYGGHHLWTVGDTTAEVGVGVAAMGAGIILLLFAIFAARMLATTALDTANDWWKDQL